VVLGKGFDSPQLQRIDYQKYGAAAVQGCERVRVITHWVAVGEVVSDYNLKEYRFESCQLH